MTEETNVFFEVNGNDHVVLKIFQEESSKLEDNLIEAFMLEQVSIHTDIVFPNMIKNKDGEYITFIEVDDIIERYKWVTIDELKDKYPIPSAYKVDKIYRYKLVPIFFI